MVPWTGRRPGLASGWRVAVLFLAACSGGEGGGAAAITAFAYELPSAAYRVGEEIPPNVPLVDGAQPDAFEVQPALPAGLALDPLTGVLTGSPEVEVQAAQFVVTALVGGVGYTTGLELVVGPALPPAIEYLEPGFVAEVVAEGVASPVKMALAPDGRLFFNELASGNVQILEPGGAWLPAPFVQLGVETGSHRGLLGLCLAPDFADSGHVYVMATFPAQSGEPAKTRVLRYRDELDVGVEETVIVDDLPVADINNGGELLFDASGNLLVTVGDVMDPALAQDPASPAGKVLRFTPAGGIPADNPDPQSPVLCLGLRNTFALALHPATGGLYGADNGPDQDDELNFLVPGRNFEWGYEGDGLGSEAGYTIRTWKDVITPTALAFHPGVGGWQDHANQLFLASYTEENVRRIVLLGEQFTDFHLEHELLCFQPAGIANKPLDILVAPDGSVYVSTFTAIFRLRAM